MKHIEMKDLISFVANGVADIALTGKFPPQFEDYLYNHFLTVDDDVKSHIMEVMYSIYNTVN